MKLEEFNYSIKKDLKGYKTKSQNDVQEIDKQQPIGDKVLLYLPDKKEKNAFTASSVNSKSSDSDKRIDPSIKSISTKHGKEVLFKKDAIEIVANGKLLMKLTDEGGIEISSNKKIELNASEDIEINGGSKIFIQGESGIDLKQGDTTLSILDDVSLTGSKVNIE